MRRLPPNRARRSGKSDPLDAIEAARAALGGRAKSIAKSRDGAVEAIRALLVAKRSARTARTSALVQMRELLVSGPDQLRTRLRGLSISALTVAAARLRVARGDDLVLTATKTSLSSLAHRVQRLDDELVELEARIEALLTTHCPDLLGLFGVGPDTAAALVVCAGDNPQRVRSEAGRPGGVISAAMLADRELSRSGTCATVRWSYSGPSSSSQPGEPSALQAPMTSSHGTTRPEMFGYPA